MFLNLATGCLGMGALSLEERIRLASAHGFGGIDVPLDGIATMDDAAMWAERIRSAGLRCGVFWLPRDLSAASEAEFEECVQWVGRTAPLAAAIGLRRSYCHIWSGSDVRGFEENFAWHLDRIRRVRDLLWGHGIEFGLEFLGPRHLWAEKKYPFIRDLEGAMQIIAAAGEAVGMVFDTYHWHCSGGQLEGLREKLAQVRIVNVHLNDAPAGRAREEQVDRQRLMPEESGVIPARKILALLSEIGYDGPVIAEPFSPWVERFKALAADEVAATVAARLLPLFPG